MARSRARGRQRRDRHRQLDDDLDDVASLLAFLTFYGYGFVDALNGSDDEDDWDELRINFD